MNPNDPKASREGEGRPLNTKDTFGGESVLAKMQDTGWTPIAAAPPEPTDGQGQPTDSEMLDWLEATVFGKGASAFLKSIFISTDYYGHLMLDVKTRPVICDTDLRSAIRAAMKGEGRG